jgi:hypothetical protein
LLIDTAIRFMNAGDGDQVLVGAGTVVLPDNTDDTTGPGHRPRSPLGIPALIA